MSWFSILCIFFLQIYYYILYRMFLLDEKYAYLISINFPGCAHVAWWPWCYWCLCGDTTSWFHLLSQPGQAAPHSCSHSQNYLKNSPGNSRNKDWKSYPPCMHTIIKVSLAVQELLIYILLSSWLSCICSSIGKGEGYRLEKGEWISEVWAHIRTITCCAICIWY